MYGALIRAIDRKTDGPYPGDAVWLWLLVFIVTCLAPLGMILIFVWNVLKGMGVV